jgi:hypothetical protein
VANFELLKKDATGYRPIDNRHPNFNLLDPDIAEVLRYLFYRKAMRHLSFTNKFKTRSVFNKDFVDDVVNEMYLLCLKGYKPSNLDFLFTDAMRSLFGDTRIKKRQRKEIPFSGFYEDTISEDFYEKKNTNTALNFISELNEENFITKEIAIPYLNKKRKEVRIRTCKKKLTPEKEAMILEWVLRNRPFVVNRRIFHYINKEAKHITKVIPRIPSPYMYQKFYSYALIDFPRSTLELVTDRTEEIQRFVSACRADTLYCLDRDYANLICRLEVAVFENERVHAHLHKVKHARKAKPSHAT